jgi:hypothetical protein
MATWEFKVTGLEVMSDDESDWPITQIVNDTVQIEENNIIRLHRKAKDIIRKKFPKYCSIIINSFERIDKKTGKDYGVFEDTTDLLVYNLSSAQRANLEQLKAQILEEVVGHDKLRDDLRLLMSDDGSVKYITDNLACLQSRHRTIIHDEAEKIITAIDRFYSRITPNELAILCMEESAVSHEELQLLRSYSFHERQQAKSVRNQKVIFLKSKIHTADSLQIKEDELISFLDLSHKTGLNIFSKLLEWAVDNSEELLEKLESLNIDSLQKLNTIVGISNLKSVLTVWLENKENADEEFWQTTIGQNSFVLSQVFSFPVIVLKGKAYVGGKGIENSGGNLVDFLCARHLTRNSVLIEIKTPKTKILSSKYREDIYNISDEVSGSIIQIANYKDALTKEYDRLVNRSSGDFEVFNPPCLVILGNLEEELTSPKQKKSFELFRNGLKDVQIITYDELFKKVEILVNLLEGNNSA